nr:MAG TPA: hypothetical protein [Caudoviricetes sp.]
MTDIRSVSAFREVVLEFDVKPNVINVVRETLTGDPAEPEKIANTATVVREILVNFDITPSAVTAIRETLCADEPVIDYLVGGGSVIREVLIAEPPIKLATAIRESLVSLSESVSLRHIVGAFWQDALVPRITPDPAGVQSMRYSGVLRELVTLRRESARPRSKIDTNTLIHQTAIQRSPYPPEHGRTPIQAKTFRRMSVLSRTDVYTPVSEIRLKGTKQSVVQGRDFAFAPDIRSSISIPRLTQQIVLSRSGAPVVITTDAFVAGHVQQVLQAIDTPVQVSEIDAKTLRSMIVVERVTTPPGIDDRVAGFKQTAVMSRTPQQRIGAVIASQLRSQVAQARPVIPAFSPIRVPGVRELVATRRDTVPPHLTLGTHAATLRFMSVHRVNMLAPYSTMRVTGLRIAFTIDKRYPLPWDVIDPTVGRHVPALRMLALQHRVTTPPEVISKESRYAYSVLERVVLGDKFPPPDPPEPVIPETFVNQVVQIVALPDPDGWEPVSALTVHSATETLVVGDAEGWVDPTIPVSEISVDGVVQAVVAGDSFLDPAIPQSSVDAVAVSQIVAVGDTTMPDPTLPQSEVQAVAVAEFAALGDADWSDPAIPLSDATVSLLTAFLAVRDPSLTGQFGMSEISSPSVVEFYVVRDPALKGIPLRQGPRPVVSVTIS